MLFQQHAPVDEMLFDIGDEELHFEFSGVLFVNLLDPVKNRFQSGQIGDEFNLAVKALQFFDHRRDVSLIFHEGLLQRLYSVALKP